MGKIKNQQKTLHSLFFLLEQISYSVFGVAYCFPQFV